MARSLRIQYPGAYYHVMARGNRREAIFLDDDDRRFFLKAVSQACEMTGWRVHAWVLMGNHYHLFIETPEGNLVEGMKWLQNTYTRRYNVRHRAWGRVFGDRYKAVLVEGGAAHYYQTLVDYIHLNPVRARLIRPNKGESVLDYAWCSLAGGYALPPKKRAPWLAAEWGLESFGLDDTVAGRRRMVERLDKRAVEESAKNCGVPLLPDEVDARLSHLRKGWYWGTQAFAERAMKLIQGMSGKGKSRAYRATPERKAHGLTQAERWLAEGLTAAGLDAAELKRTKGSDARKVVLAKLLWERTTVSQDWLAEKLHMRSAANVCMLLGAQAAKKKRLLPEALGRWVRARTD